MSLWMILIKSLLLGNISAALHYGSVFEGPSQSLLSTLKSTSKINLDVG